MIGQDLRGTTLEGTRPEITGAPVTGVRPTPPNVNSGANDKCRCCPPRLAKLPVENPPRLVEVRSTGCCWVACLEFQDPRHRHAARRRRYVERPCGSSPRRHTALRVVGHRRACRRHVATASAPLTWSARNSSLQRFSYTNLGHRRETPCVVPGRTRDEIRHFGVSVIQDR